MLTTTHSKTAPQQRRFQFSTRARVYFSITSHAGISFNLAGVERSTPLFLHLYFYALLAVMIELSRCLNNLRLLVQFTFTLEE